MIRKESGIEYEVIKSKKGSNINLLFVHGSGCNKAFLRELVLLFKDFNCYLIDLPGHGGSDNTGYNEKNYVKSIVYLAKKLSNVIIIGHSLGGTLALKTASLKLKSVKGVVAMSSAAKWGKLDKEFMEKIYQGFIDEKWLMEAAGHLENKDVVNAMKTMEPNGHTIVDFLLDDGIDIRSSLSDIKIPTLIIDGDSEILALPEYSEELIKSIKGSELVMIPNGKHMVCLAEKYKFKELICDFISRKIIKNKKLVLV